MDFNEKLNEYFELLNCSGKELSDSSGLSAAVISRYRAGERVPSQESDQLRMLASGIAALSKKDGSLELTQEQILTDLTETLAQKSVGNQVITDNLNALIGALDINTADMARAMNYDASYISRIRSGQRRPSNSEHFADGICRFVVHRYRRDSDKTAIADLLGKDQSAIAEEHACYRELKEWLCSGSPNDGGNVEGFLKKLDEFDLNEYIRSIHFDELKVPTVPFRLPTSKMYYGIEQMRAGELDFLKSTVLSKSTEPVFMCSDMPMEDMAESTDFSKKWMFGLAMMLKKGLHLNMIHNIDRPFKEMMLGLESWVPIYMTGQISPWYLPGKQNSVYCHLNYVSGSAALCGESISGYHGKGKYYLTNNRTELAYYREKAECLQKKARPLMDIYRQDSENALNAFISSEASAQGNRRGILTSPPVHTLPEPLLKSMLLRNDIVGEEAERILNYARKQRELTASFLEHDLMTDEIAYISEEEFDAHPAALFLAGAFVEEDVPYLYDEYKEHLRATEEYANTHPNYSVKFKSDRMFRNIQIYICKGKWVMVSKCKSPAIHFVIRQPKLREALEKLVLPVVE